MFKFIKSLFIAICCVILVFVISSFVLEILNRDQIISEKTYDYFLTGLTCLIFFIFGLIFSLNQKEYSLFICFILALLYCSLSFWYLNKENSLTKLISIFIIIKTLLLISGSAIGNKSPQ
ncbi:MAG TPA: hypothetical protein DCX39_04615 [Firmicutes bacterium]|nr:unknown [Clostridium sp. CAG:288]HAR48430.1 hypothetical protein [Bacillota bacterium]HAX00417.1 hypothetical protein [Bacillota bacterium]